MKQIDYLRKSRKNCSALLMACALTFMLLTTTLSFAQTNSLTLGCPTRNGSGYSFTSLTLSTSTSVRGVTISFSENPEGCSITATTPSGWSLLSSTSNNYVKSYTLPTNVTSEAIQNFLRSIVFSVPSNTLKNVQILLQTDDGSSERQVIYYSGNRHYYEYVAGTVPWTTAYTAAKARNYCGRQGYLATLTSAGEDQFVSRLVQNAMWLGGTRLTNNGSEDSQYFSGFSTSSYAGYWYWACGPEKGDTIINASTAVASSYVDAMSWYADQNAQYGYTNWAYARRTSNSSLYSAEPNGGSGWSSRESCLTILKLPVSDNASGNSVTRSSQHAIVEDAHFFGWNDVAQGGGSAGQWQPQGYLVEYGDLPIGDSGEGSESACAILATGMVGSAQITRSATISGNSTICADETATLTLSFDSEFPPYRGKIVYPNGNIIDTISFSTDENPYTFTVTPNETTTYTVSEFTDASSTTGSDGCPDVYNIVYETTGSATVTVNELTVEVSATHETCQENNDGEISYTVGGGTPNYTVTFAEGISATKSAAGTYTQSNLLAGDYVVKVVDSHGCSVTAPAVTINEPETLEIHQEGNIIPAQCKGDNNGQFAFSIAGGNGTNNITINGGAVTLATPSEGVYTQTGLAAGTYTVSVTDNKGCSATKNFVVGEPDAVLSATVTSTQESCTGYDGTATVAAAGGNGGYTFVWSNGQNLATAKDLSSFTNGGVYTVTVSDAKGCTNVQSVTITLNNPLAMAPITGPAVCTGTEFSITPENGTNGTIPAGTTYSWPAPDAIPGIGGLAAGTDKSSINGVLTNSNSTPQTVSYTVTPKVGVCVGNAVDVTVTVTTTVNPNVTIDMPNTMTVCSNAEIFNLSATFVNSVSNSTVVWKKDGTPMETHTITGNTDNYTIDLDNDICKGEYKYRVEYTDESGCTASDACVITVNAGDWSITQPEGDTVECVSAATEPDASLLPVVEDGCGRTTTRTFIGRESNPTEITCTGTVTYTYRYTACDGTYNDWTYTYTINDVTKPTIAADAITTKAANIDQTDCKFSIPDLIADIRAKASDNCTAAADLVISQSPAKGTVITAATDVVVTVTDKCGNSTTDTVNVTVPTLPTATIAPTHILCHGNTTGSATVTPTDGTAPYTYLWSNSQTNATATDLDNTEYTVTVTDANGCSTTASVTITEPEALAATTTTVPVDCYGNSTGSATITVTGGTPSYSVIVNEVTKSGNDTLTFENLPKGTYPVTIKDANNCELTGVSITITEPEVLAISAELTQVKCKDGNNGAIDLTVTGGNGSYQYVWNNDATTQDLTNLTAGDYNVTVKDAKNCSISGTYTITEPALLQISSITPTNITCPSGNDGKIEVAVTGGTTPYSYQLNGGTAQSSAIFETLTAGNYTVTVTDANGCSTTSSTTLTQPDPLALTGCPTNITKNTDAGESYATVTWTEPTFSPIGNGATLSVTGDTATNQYSVGTTTITYTVTNTCGESQSCSFTITVLDNQAPEIACTVTGNQDVLPNSAGNTYTHSGNSWNATATDNVAVDSLTYTLTGATDDNTPKTTLDGQVFNYGTTTVTWKATDNTGAIDVCSFQVVVADNTEPELKCPTIATVYECLAEVPEIYANYAAFAAAGGTATDNHQIDESSLTVTETVETGCPTTITRTYSIKDMTGNEGTCTQVITVEDKTAPALKSGSTLPAGESNMSLCFDSIPAGPTVADIKALYEDNCGGEVIVSKSGEPTGNDCGWSVTYTYVIKDTCENETTASVSYSGKTADFVMPANGTKTVQCIDDATAPTLPVIKDACGTVLEPKTSSMVDSPSPLICEGTRTYTYTYEDCAGHTHDWTYTYTIEREDFEMPADGSKTVACASEISAPALPTVTDNCGDTLTGVLKEGYPTATPACEGTVTYVYTYTDCEGNSHDWTYTYTIEREDFEMPDNDSSTVACASAIEEPTLPIVKDACGDTLTGVLKSGYPTATPSCEGTVTYVYTFTDCEGNTHDWTYTYTIEREDFTIPADTGSTVACIDDATEPTAPSVTDNCGNALTPSAAVEGGTYDDDGCEGTRTYTFTYTDCEGNTHDWTYTYTITAPTLTFTGSITDVDDVDACYSESHKAQLLTADQVKAMYTSSCSREISVEISDNVVSSSDCNWKITRTYSISDGGCNTDSKTMSVSGSDQTAPALADTWPSDITGKNSCLANADTTGLKDDSEIKALYSDCSTITVTHTDTIEGNACDWTVTRTYTIKDACGNTVTPAPTMSVSGSDQTAPAIGTDDLDRTLTATNCVFTIPDMREIVRNISTDCSEITVTQPSAGMVVYPMVAERDTTVNVIVTDSCGNSSVKEVVITIPAKVTISATATPATICYGATSQLTATPSNVVGTATYNWTPSDGLNSATIANPVATLTTTTTYTVEVTDENGCAATATTTVNVNPEVVMDTVAPMTLCVGDVTSYSFTTPLTVGTMSYAWTNSNTAIGLAANGEGDILSFTPTNTTNAPINATITVTPSHTYNDITCVGDPINFTITVRPSIKTPGNVEFACPADTTVVLSYSECEQLVNIGEPEFVNHMSGMNVNITNDAPAGNIFPEGTTIVTWTATDECGAFLTCTQSVVVQFPPCGDTIADFDGYRYSSVRIGCQCWTGENARSEHYSDGTPVDNFRYYNDSDSLENIYGKLYTWYTAVRVPEGDNNAEPSGTTDPFGTTYVQGICPEGWALPTVNEYMQMIANSGDATHAKDGSNLYWLPGYEGQPPFSGFDAYGAGKYNGAIDRYQELLGKTYFWTTLSGSGSETATTVEINYYCAEGLQTELSKGDGVSIRCIRKR